MKKTLAACLIVIASLQAYAYTTGQLRLAFDLQSDFNMDKISFNSIVNDSFGNPERIFWGTMIEIAVGHTGFGVTGLVNLPPTLTTGDASSTVSWDGGLFYNNHLFGVGRLLDPYVGIGFNCAGSFTIERSEIYGETNWGRSSYNPVTSGALSLSLYPYAAAGLGIDLDGLLVGVKLSIQPYQFGLPDITKYVTPTYSLDLYGGFALGGHR